jgi:hypothetical protein
MKFLPIIALFFCLNTLSAQTLNPAERPLPQRDMPRFAKFFYEDDLSKLNFNTVKKAFDAWHKAELKDRSADAFEENIYEEYYKRWCHSVLPYVQTDGSIKMPTLEESTDFDNKRRQEYADAQRKRQNSTERSPLINWTLFGPTKTIFQYKDKNTQPVAPWQVNIYAIDIAPSNANIVYCTSETGAVNKSTDKGLTWAAVGLDYFTYTQQTIAVHPTNPDIVYTGGINGLHSSINGGTTWSAPLSISNFNCNDIAFKTDAPSVILAAGSSLQRYNGAVWSNVLNKKTYDLEFKTNAPSVVFALVNNSATNLCEFWKSTDGGQNFSVRSSGWISGLSDGGGRLAVSAADANIVYAILITGGGTRLAKSTDAGESWTITNLSANASLTDWDRTGGQDYYDLSIAASQTDANKVIFGITSAYRSVDGGANWAAIGGYSGAFDIHPDIQEIKSVGNDTWIATDGGTTYSSDFFGADAQYRINGLVGTHFWGFDVGWNEDVIVGGRYHNGNTARHDNFPTGLYLRMGGGEAPTGYVNPLNNKMNYYSDIGGFVIGASPNALATTFPISKFPNENYYSMDYSELEFDPRYSQTFILGKDNKVWKTTDNGKNFTTIYTSDNALSRVLRVKIARSDPNTMYLTENTNSADGRIFKSTNGGTSWTVCNPPTGTIANERAALTIAVSASDANTLWVTYRSAPNGRKIYKSTDSGATWTNLTTTVLNEMSVSDMVHQFGSDGGIYLIGDYGKVFYRNNTMSNWTAFSTGLPLALNGEISRIKLNYTKKKVRIAANMGIWENDFFESSTTSFAQPIVDKSEALCARDTFTFGSYSVQNGAATYNWTISPTPQYISSPTAQSPKVVFGAVGTYSATLSITDANGIVSKTVPNMVTIATDNCALSAIPTKTGTFSGTSTSNAKSVNPAPNFGATQDFTVSFWFKSSSATSDAAIVTDKNWDNSGYNGWVFSLSNGRIWFNIGDDEGHHIDIYSQNGLNNNAWHHVAASVSRTGNAVLYVDGIVNDISTGANKSLTSAAALLDIYSGYPLAIGGDPNNNYPFVGQVDEIKIWKTALTQAQLRENMHLTALVSDQNLIDYYQFNDATTVEYDRGGGGNNLTFSANATRSTSTAPVGGGTSFRMTVNSSGEKVFTGTDVKLTFASGSLPNGEIVVSKINNNPDQTPSAALSLLNRYYIVRNWGTNVSFTALSNVTLDNLGVFASSATSSYKLYKRNPNGEGATWGSSISTATASSPTINGGFLTFGITGESSSSQLLPISDVALPVELLDFQCVLIKKEAHIQWQVATEINTEGYAIERSTDGGQTFERIGFVKARGTTNKQTNYSFIDPNPVIGSNYYRLKMLDRDGKTDFSPIRSIILRGQDLDKFSIYPNPASRLVYVDFETSRKGRVTIELVDAAGKVLLKTQTNSEIGANHYPIHVSKITEGAYFLKMTDGVTVSVQSIVIF